MSEQRQVQVPMVNLADPQNLSNPIGRLFASALARCLFDKHAMAAEKIAIFDFEVVRIYVIRDVRENQADEGQKILSSKLEKLFK
ncbi:MULTISPECIES: hypothetical protein [unclassified Mesorhizobium]|uniref:hypothetical protein n=1 Tax=unclassified Mesorhizobium TaxID=325217 RepID=UPI00112B38A2|nr:MULTISPECIES: hypothetical protein [unclassified Mesorhizobium]MBZ9983517.1 hypothetical protein [Mesorhizobium sp. BR-1-1-8]TPL35703.1 hypothetical protein FJ947_13860 [Mesorhizobium sp. B2-4-8]TPL63060.1 hypothetical protein FJ949_18620 [Mesorhizobium sp. B2-4-1]